MKNLILATLVAFFVSACGAQQVLESRATDVVVRAGVAEYIGSDAQTAQEVIDWTNDVIALIDGNPEILLTELRDRALVLIPWDELSRGQYIIAVETLAFVEDYVATQIAKRELPADATMSIRDLLETARWSAEFELALAEQ